MLYFQSPFEADSRLVFSRVFYFRGILGNVEEKPPVHTEEIRLFQSTFEENEIIVKPHVLFSYNLLILTKNVENVKLL